MPLNKPIKLHLMTIIISSVFIEDGKFYPESFLDDALYELVWKCYSTKKLMFQKELMYITQWIRGIWAFSLLGF